MAEPSSLKEINYCYRCGKRLGRGQDYCYYCTAPVHRTLREPHRCPYCAEIIRGEAKKCPHCGEFLEGKERTEKGVVEGVVEEKPRETTKIVFMIPPGLIGGDQPLFIPAGEHIAGELADRLSAGTRKAIETGRPAQVDMPNIKALPPSEARALIAAPEGSKVSASAAQAPALIDVKAKQVALPMRRQVARQVALLPVRMLRGVGRTLLKPRKKISVSPGEAPEASRFKVCARCDTEVLATDYFCYHCGLLLTSKKERRVRAPGKQKRANTGVYLAGLLLVGLHQLLFAKGFPRSIDGLLVLAFALSVYGVIRRPGLGSLIWFLLTLGVAGYLLSGGAFVPLPSPPSPSSGG